MDLFKDPKFNFMVNRRKAFVLSGTLIFFSIVSFIVFGLNYGVDFVGGTSIQLRFEKPVGTSVVRSSALKTKLGVDKVQTFGSDRDLLVHIIEQGDEFADLLITQLTTDFADNRFEVLSIDQVGPKIGSELKYAAVWATLSGLAVILIYLSIRFQYKFAVGAVAALFHDVFITLGIFSIFQIEFSLAIIAAFLTIIGYSVNDTIVVFDRIRENVRLLKRGTADFTATVDRSINQTLSRTVMTSTTTLIVVVSLLIFGGQGLRSFALALTIGIVIGTYSSIFVASPVLVEWKTGESLTK